MAYTIKGNESSLHAAIEKQSHEWLDFLVRLVQTPSILGDEKACQDIVRKAMTSLGVFERMVYPSNDPPFHRTGRSYADRGCVVGRIPGTGCAPAFVLNAHIDTAPVEDASSWTHPPFSGVIDNGRLYGRGALDDKAGVAMLLLLSQVLKREGIRLPGDIILESVIEDEDSGNGTLACTKAGYFAGAGIVIDGAWPFRIIEGHLGQLWITVKVRGTPAPACSMMRAKDPVAGALRAVNSLRELVAAKNKVAAGLEFQSPYFCCLGSIHAGTWAGAVPESCTLQVQIGFPPPDTPEGMLAQIRETVLAALPDFEGNVSLEVGSLCAPPFSNKDNATVRILRQVIERLRPEGMEVKPVIVTGHCDLRHLLQADGRPADACLYGPGGGGNPHCNNEYYMVEHFVPVAQNIMSTILTYFNML
ncbi:M20 family metallopeptidase [Solidesulfovibrio sp.]